MQFLRTLFWVVVAVFLAILGRNNWSDVTLNLWGPFQADIKIPLLILITFLIGFLPTFLVLRGRIWALKRRIAVAQRPPETIVNPPAPGTTDDLTAA
ncbi:LapA family protein [Sphingomonas sp. KRR8]|uniref:LapA family protein n=1 Tax=Sphingomonas sp. KRR8 TaxID=2942996 RepID=UPI0020216874|nr:LapA family protein [Sphingomonas sp. KRR8]URD62270.1 LapA family protein [Sphingomonas sp. KRR8]